MLSIRPLRMIQLRIGRLIRFVSKVSGYSAYLQEAYKTPGIQKLPPPERFAAVAAMWKIASPETKEKWNAYAARISQAGDNPPQSSKASASAKTAKTAKTAKAAKPEKEKAAKPTKAAKAAKDAKAAAGKKAAGKKTTRARASQETKAKGKGKEKGKGKGKAKSATRRPRSTTRRAAAKIRAAPKPVKRISAYHAYMKKAYSHPDIKALPVHQRMSTIAKQWKALSAEEKKPYIQQALATQPKKTVSAYTLFVKEAQTRAEIKALPFTQRIKKLAEQWKGMSAEQKKPYQAQATALSPRKKVSGYQLFGKEIWARPENKALPFQTVLKKISEQWKTLPESQKQAYKNRAVELSPPPTSKVPKVSAYHLFVKKASRSRGIQALPPPQRLSAIAKQWKALPAEEKKPYIEQALALQPKKRKIVSAYTLFTKESHSRADIKALPFAERAKKIAEQWKGMSAEQKKPYQAQATALSPRKKVSAYQLFVKEMWTRPEIKAMPFEAVGKKIAEQWKALPEVQKKAFQDRAVELSPPVPPKRVSPYGIFVREAFLRPEIKALPFGEPLQKIASIWKGMSADEKRPYIQKAEQLSPPKGDIK